LAQLPRKFATIGDLVILGPNQYTGALSYE
jgi:hypothetical protein